MLIAKAIKATLVLNPAEVAAMRVPEGQRVVLTIDADGRKVSADIACKSLRKAIAAIAEHGVEGCAVILQGKLRPGDVLAEAGLVVQPKVRPPVAAAA
jgi:hypothetical protein